MNHLFKTLLIASFTLGCYSATAANNSTNTEDSQEGLVQNESGVTEQSSGKNMRKSTSQSKKSMTKNNRQSRQSMDYKMMDSDSDGMISKDEYMTYHEQSYGKMKHTNDNVSIKDMEDYKYIGTTKGNKLQPSNTKDAPPVVSR